MKFLLLIILLTSCATKSLTLKQKELLPYKESNQLTKLDGIKSSIRLSSIVDKRSITSYGSAYTGVQYKKTPLVFDATLESIVKDYLSTAFEMRNVRVEQDGDIDLKVEVEQIWVEEVIENFQPEKAKCNVKMSFHVNRGAKKWSGRFWAEYLSSGDLSDGTEKLAPTLASCMNEVVEKLVSDNKFLQTIR